ncbi:hypothetical protein IIC38_19550 [candidate division KSB1 bacterium]|nr:hypothetical protein [candidate division KSB1 bacterium]
MSNFIYSCSVDAVNLVPPKPWYQRIIAPLSRYSAPCRVSRASSWRKLSMTGVDSLCW